MDGANHHECHARYCPGRSRRAGCQMPDQLRADKTAAPPAATGAVMIPFAVIIAAMALLIVLDDVPSA